MVNSIRNKCHEIIQQSNEKLLRANTISSVTGIRKKQFSIFCYSSLQLLHDLHKMYIDLYFQPLYNESLDMIFFIFSTQI